MFALDRSGSLLAKFTRLADGPSQGLAADSHSGAFQAFLSLTSRSSTASLLCAGIEGCPYIVLSLRRAPGAVVFALRTVRHPERITWPLEFTPPSGRCPRERGRKAVVSSGYLPDLLQVTAWAGSIMPQPHLGVFEFQDFDGRGVQHKEKGPQPSRLCPADAINKLESMKARGRVRSAPSNPGKIPRHTLPRQMVLGLAPSITLADQSRAPEGHPPSCPPAIVSSWSRLPPPLLGAEV
ncbi:hypothetical protein SKAU_G00309340 [Synaphobranchus kaupii]|uniref:Uncharacterized protein n=1 Tax=Synaphobranchus kaupii TaxID=118154 RepID=A0A9Q1ERD0_SYNKA|nr:hypothetical protein SKAU_G00309340 [Synaphobranchus kaupii]